MPTQRVPRETSCSFDECREKPSSVNASQDGIYSERNYLITQEKVRQPRKSCQEAGEAHLVMGHNFSMQMRLKVPRKMPSHFLWERLLHHPCSEGSVYSLFPLSHKCTGYQGREPDGKKVPNYCLSCPRHKLVSLSKSFGGLGFKVARKVYVRSRCWFVGRMGGPSDPQMRGKKGGRKMGTPVCSKVTSVTLGNSSSSTEVPPYLPWSNTIPLVPLQGSVTEGELTWCVGGSV